MSVQLSDLNLDGFVKFSSDTLGGKFVAVGNAIATNGGTIFSSSTGLNWTQRTAPQTGSGPFTVEFWYLQPTASTTPQMFVTQYTAAGSGRTIIYIGDTSNSGKVILHIAATVSIVSSTTPTANTWHHVAVTRDANDLFTLWIDGISNGTTTNSVVIDNVSTIIGDRTVTSNPFNGYMDDVRITAGVARYTTTFTPPTSSLPTQ